jgi:hypothetical protein
MNFNAEYGPGLGYPYRDPGFASLGAIVILLILLLVYIYIKRSRRRRWDRASNETDHIAPLPGNHESREPRRRAPIRSSVRQKQNRF